MSSSSNTTNKQVSHPRHARPRHPDRGGFKDNKEDTHKPKNDRGWGGAGAVGWGVLGAFGSLEKDTRAQVLKKGTSDPNVKMVKNEKGLWVKVRVEEGVGGGGGGRGRGSGIPLGAEGEMQFGGLQEGGEESYYEDDEEGRGRCEEEEEEDGRRKKRRSTSRSPSRSPPRRGGGGDDRDRDRNRGRDRDRDRRHSSSRDHGRDRERGDSRQHRRDMSYSRSRSRSRSGSRERERRRDQERRRERERGKDRSSSRDRDRKHSHSHSHRRRSQSRSPPSRDRRKEERRHRSRSGSREREREREQERSSKKQERRRRSESPDRHHKKKERERSSSRDRNRESSSSKKRRSPSAELPPPPPARAEEEESDAADALPPPEEMSFTAAQLADRLVEIYNAKSSHRYENLAQCFAPDVKLCVLKTGTTVLSGVQALTASMPADYAKHTAEVTRRLYIHTDHAEDPSFSLDFYPAGKGPGMNAFGKGNVKMDTILLYEAGVGARNRIAQVWIAPDRDEFASGGDGGKGKEVTELSILSSKVFPQVAAVMKTKGVKGKVSYHFHDYTQMETIG